MVLTALSTCALTERENFPSRHYFVFAEGKMKNISLAYLNRFRRQSRILRPLSRRTTRRQATKRLSRFTSASATGKSGVLKTRRSSSTLSSNPNAMTSQKSAGFEDRVDEL